MYMCIQLIVCILRGGCVSVSSSHSSTHLSSCSTLLFIIYLYEWFISRKRSMYWCYRKFKNCVLSIVGDVRIQGDLSMNGVINVIDANNSTTGMISVTNDGLVLLMMIMEKMKTKYLEFQIFHVDPTLLLFIT